MDGYIGAQIGKIRMDERKCTYCALCTENTFCSCIILGVRLGPVSLALSSKLTDGQPINIFWFNATHQQHGNNNIISRNVVIKIKCKCIFERNV